MSTAREICPAANLTVDEYLAHRPDLRAHVISVRRQKALGTRPRPSETLVDRSAILTREQRALLVDKGAALVDENLCGRSDMCKQFAELMALALQRLGFRARAAVGTAEIPLGDGAPRFEWGHAWVRIAGEVIDGNVDSTPENPMVPAEVVLAPYWGPIRHVPPDRFLREIRGKPLRPDEDVEKIWWPV